MTRQNPIPDRSDVSKIILVLATSCFQPCFRILRPVWKNSTSAFPNGWRCGDSLTSRADFQQRLAEKMGMTKVPVSRLVERLVQKELVYRQDSRNDGRAQQIWLSSAGQKLVPKLAAIADENDEAFFGDLTMNARLAMIALMKDIAKQYRLTQVPVD